MRPAWPALVLGVTLPWLATPTGAPPSSTTVATSRGDHSLLVYAPATADSRAEAARRPLVLIVSGEGGWRSFDGLLARFLSETGYWVGGIDAMKYFWRAQDDRKTLASDVRAFADALAKAAGSSKDAPLLLMGYSFGADLAPWIAGAGAWGDRIRGLVMIGPDETGSLEFRFSELLGFDSTHHVFRVSEALRSAAGIPVLFLHGDKDSSSAALSLLNAASEPKKLLVVSRADHHFSGREDELREALREGLLWLLSCPARSSPTKAAP